MPPDIKAYYASLHPETIWCQTDDGGTIAANLVKGSLVTLNGVSALVLTLCAKRSSIGQMIQEVTGNFSPDEQKGVSEVLSTLDKLAEKGLIDLWPIPPPKEFQPPEQEFAG